MTGSTMSATPQWIPSEIFLTPKSFRFSETEKMNEITALDIRDWQQRIKEMGETTGLPYSEHTSTPFTHS